ncbi:hypothetical protein HK098_004744 [Nowakowskiella sp. JEL0407]|nr:hypothetical protein HK098_004744 [Nowakowskiella sp. JEL0407]
MGNSNFSRQNIHDSRLSQRRLIDPRPGPLRSFALPPPQPRLKTIPQQPAPKLQAFLSAEPELSMSSGSSGNSSRTTSLEAALYQNSNISAQQQTAPKGQRRRPYNFSSNVDPPKTKTLVIPRTLTPHPTSSITQSQQLIRPNSIEPSTSTLPQFHIPEQPHLQTEQGQKAYTGAPTLTNSNLQTLTKEPESKSTQHINPSHNIDIAQLSTFGHSNPSSNVSSATNDEKPQVFGSDTTNVDHIDSPTNNIPKPVSPVKRANSTSNSPSPTNKPHPESLLSRLLKMSPPQEESTNNSDWKNPADAPANSLESSDSQVTLTDELTNDLMAQPKEDQNQHVNLVIEEIKRSKSKNSKVRAPLILPKMTIPPMQNEIQKYALSRKEIPSYLTEVQPDSRFKTISNALPTSHLVDYGWRLRDNSTLLTVQDCSKERQFKINGLDIGSVESVSSACDGNGTPKKEGWVAGIDDMDKYGTSRRALFDWVRIW